MGRKHAHKYGRKAIYSGRTIVWACHWPGCSHYMPVGTLDGMLLNKFSFCWECGKQFVLGTESLKHDHPCCSMECQGKYNESIQVTEQLQNYMVQKGQDVIEVVVPRTEVKEEIKNQEIRICKKCGKGKVPEEATVPLCIMCSYPMSPREVMSWKGK